MIVSNGKEEISGSYNALYAMKDVETALVKRRGRPSSNVRDCCGRVRSPSSTLILNMLSTKDDTERNNFC